MIFYLLLLQIEKVFIKNKTILVNELLKKITSGDTIINGIKALIDINKMVYYIS